MTEPRPIANSSSPPDLAIAGMVDWGEPVFLSGCLGKLPGTRRLAEGGFAVEARRVFANLVAGFADAGLAPMDVVRITIYLAELGRFALVETLFVEVFGVGKVARTTIEPSRVGLGASTELDAIEVRSSSGAVE